MPEKTRAFRTQRAKAQGTTMTLKASDVPHEAEGLNPHKAKKMEDWVQQQVGFEDRNVSPRKPPGHGLTAKSRKLPLPETGSSTSRRKTLPSEAAAGYTKTGQPKRTTGRGDVTPLKASKKLTRVSRKRPR
jgi:hypothetical protein